MKDAPSFNWYPERWLAGTADMTEVERARYFQLLCHSWLRDGLPNDPAVLARLAGGKLSDAVLSKFPACEDGLRRNARLEAERAEQRERITKARASANARWGKNKPSSICSDDANASVEHMRTHNLSITSPLTTHHSPNVLLEKEPKARASGGDDFDEACASELEPMSPEPVKAAWAEYQQYRQRRHKLPSVTKGKLDWTAAAAKRAVSAIESALSSGKLSEQQVLDHITTAIDKNWKGFFFNDLIEQLQTNERASNFRTGPYRKPEQRTFAAFGTPDGEGRDSVVGAI